MEIRPFRVEHYVTPDGHVPFQKWLDSLRDVKTFRIVDRRLTRLEAGALGDCKYFDSILELRIDYGPGYRIYCGKKKEGWIILLVGGSKSSQEKDIEKAKRYWEDFQKRISSQHPL